MPLPSLNLLRSFAVLGDTLHVKRAAERLHVTPTAISHQLRELETVLGTKLFVRQARGLAFTSSGQQFWDEVAPAMAQLTQALQVRLAQRPLRISCFPYLAQTVVMPQLAELQALTPGRALSLDTRRDTLALTQHGLDLGLRFAPEDCQWPGLRARRLCGCAGVPVVGGSFATVPWPPSGDLPSIRLTKENFTWPAWAAVHGWQPKAGGLVLDSYAAVLSAAAQGMGVAMGFLPLCIAELEDGRVRPLWPGTEAAQGALWAVWPPEAEEAALMTVVESLAGTLHALEQRSISFFQPHHGHIGQ